MFRVSARTVLELGSELISSDAIAFYELIKNSIDAKSTNGVTIAFDIVLPRRDFLELMYQSSQIPNLEETKNAIIDLVDSAKDRLVSSASDIYGMAFERLDGVVTPEGLQAALMAIDEMNSISIIDTGTGMSLEILNSVFLVIGTKSRRDGIDAALAEGLSHAPHLGEKGIGRLSAMRLGEILEVTTAQSSDTNLNKLVIDWRDFDVPGKMIEDVAVAPEEGQLKPEPSYHGTQITIRKLRANWDRNRVQRIAVDDFSLLMNPLGKSEQQRFAVLWNGERINFERLDTDFLSHAHATLRGKYKIENGYPSLDLKMEISNLGFEHPMELRVETLSSDDLLASLVGLRQKRSRENKRDVNAAALTTVGPFDFELFWFNRSTLRKGRDKAEFHALRNLLDQWMGVRLYRDDFRVYPYGTEDDDWLELDRTALRAKGYALNRIQFVGQVEIGRITNPALIDQTNREGLRQTPEEAVLKEAIQLAVDRLRDEMKRVQDSYKESKPRIPTDPTRTKSLEKRMTRAIRSFSRSATTEQRELVSEFEAMRDEFARYAAEARERIAELEVDADQMVAMAGIGLMVEVVAHELARAAENALDTLNTLQRKSVPEDVKERLNSLRASMKTISKRLRILDPLSVPGRQRKERFDLDDLVRDLLAGHEAQFERHKIKLNPHYPERPVPVRAVKGMVVQVLENLISNAVYWMDIEQQRKLGYSPELTIEIEDNPPRVRISDNGPGIAPEYKERIFDLFFSLKDKSRRRGLGLYIAREAAEHNGGTLVIDLSEKNREGRYSTFDYRVVETSE